jgi:hypothetical protein
MIARLRLLAADQRTPVALLAVASLLATVMIVHWQRGSGIWFDPWDFLLHRDQWSLAAIFGDYNGHLMPVTAIGFGIDRELFGPGAPGLLTAFSITAHLAVVWALFVYLSKRLGAWIAAGCALLVMFFGSGHEVIVWSFNFGWLVAIAAGVAAVNVFEREDSRRNRILAVLLLFLSLCGNNIGLVFVAAILVQALYGSTRRQAISVAAVPLGTWLLWYLVEGHGGRSFVPKAWPDWVGSMVEATFSGLPGSLWTVNAWGAPLAVLAGAIGLWRLAQHRRIEPRLASALVMPIVFIALLTVTRGGIYDATASRYRYTLLVLLALAFGELLRGVRLKTAGAWLGFLLVLGFCIAGNLPVMANGAAYFRGGYESNREYMAALLLAGPEVAKTTRYDNLDPAVRPTMNADVYEWLTERGGARNAWSAEQLGEQPVEVRQRVKKVVREMQKSAALQNQVSK